MNPALYDLICKAAEHQGLSPIAVKDASDLVALEHAAKAIGCWIDLTVDRDGVRLSLGGPKDLMSQLTLEPVVLHDATLKEHQDIE